MSKPSVGSIVLMSCPLNLRRIVVFPALSKPRMRTLNVRSSLRTFLMIERRPIVTEFYVGGGWCGCKEVREWREEVYF